jgi:alpha-L-fucosidase 2
MFLIICYLFVTSHLENSPLILRYDSPANNWETQSLPLGNGFIGASIFGAVELESITLNDHTLWSGWSFFLCVCV